MFTDMSSDITVEHEPNMNDSLLGMQPHVEQEHTNEPDIFLQRPVYGGPTQSEVSEGKTRVQTRISEIRNNMTKAEKAKTTFAVALVKIEDDQTVMWISSAGKKGVVPTRVRGTDTVIKNKSADGDHENRYNDAEQKLIREARKRGAEIISIGATRAMCHKCQETAEREHMIDKVATPLKPGYIPRCGPTIRHQRIEQHSGLH